MTVKLTEAQLAELDALQAKAGAYCAHWNVKWDYGAADDHAEFFVTLANAAPALLREIRRGRKIEEVALGLLSEYDGPERDYRFPLVIQALRAALESEE